MTYIYKYININMDELIYNMQVAQILDPCPVCSNPKGLCIECKIICENYLSEECMTCGRLYLPSVTNCCS
jgi:hypothetical protein